MSKMAIQKQVLRKILDKISEAYPDHWIDKKIHYQRDMGEYEGERLKEMVIARMNARKVKSNSSGKEYFAYCALSIEIDSSDLHIFCKIGDEEYEERIDINDPQLISKVLEIMDRYYINPSI